MPVYQKNGLFYCVYYDGSKRIWEPFGRDKGARESAEARDLEIKLIKKTGQLGSSRYPSQTTYLDLYQMYMQSRKSEIAANTADGIARTVATYAAPIAHKPINQITMGDWRRMQAKMLRRGVKNRSINTYFIYLSGILTWAIEENNNLLLVHPWAKRKRLKERSRFVIDLFTTAEFQRILAYSEPHLKWILEIAYYTGVRPGPKELFSLKWSDMDWENNRIRIYAPKTDSFRWQYPDHKFMTLAKRMYKKCQKKHPDCPWICHFNGKQIKSIKRTWKNAKKKAGITRRIRLYDIRHFYITYALANGADIMELAKRVGHVNPRMIVNVYAHLAKDLQNSKPFKLPALKTVDTNSRQKKGRQNKTA